MSNSKNVPTSKKATTKKVNAKKESSKVLDLENLSNEELLNLDLESVNIFDLMTKNKDLKKTVSNTSKEQKKPLYRKEAKKENESDKRFRNRMRTDVKRFKNKLHNAIEHKNEKEQKNIVSEFLDFYKKYYSKNDFTPESLSRKNSESDTFASTKIFLVAVKQLKIKFKIK